MRACKPMVVALLLTASAITGCGSGGDPPGDDEVDGVLECPDPEDHVVGVANPSMDDRGPDTAVSAAEQQLENIGLDGTLVEINVLRFSVVDNGLEIAVIEVAEAPAGGFVAVGTETCQG